MSLSLTNINNYIDEIQYYEQMGYHKIADKLTKTLLKLSYDFNPSDMGYGPYSKNISNLGANARLMGILRNTPECLNLLNDINNTQLTNWEDPRDCRARLSNQWQQQNPGKAITPEVLQGIQEQCLNSVNSSENGFGNNLSFEACQDALTQKGYENALNDLTGTKINTELSKGDPSLFATTKPQVRDVPRIV